MTTEGPLAIPSVPAGALGVSLPAAARDGAGTHRLGPSSWRTGADGVDLVVRRIPGLAGTGAAEALRHLVASAASVPEVVVPLAVFEEDDSVVVLRPWVEGVCLAGAADAVVPGDRASRSAELAERLDDLERRLARASCRHGGIGPTNVLVRPDGGLALVDIGLSAVTEGLAEKDLDRTDSEGFARLRRSLGATRPRRRPPTHGKWPWRRSAIPVAVAVFTVFGVFLAIGRSGGGPPPLCGTTSAPATTVPGLSRECVAVASWSSGVGRLLWAGGATTFSVGRPGDVFLVGRWTCLGAQLPAVYRPSTGQFWVFPSWPTAGAVRSLPARFPGSGGTVGGPRQVRVVRAGRCDKVRVG